MAHGVSQATGFMASMIVLLLASSELGFASMHGRNQDLDKGIKSDDILTYDSTYFESINPATAHDMVRRIPGFQVDDGDVLRGFGVSVGNVLINNARPVSKAERVSTLLQRIPASRVERIELIRGGVPGIDLGGHAVVANIVLRHGSFQQHSVEAETLLFYGGPRLFQGNYDFSSIGPSGEWSLRLGRDPIFTDSTGTGRSVLFDEDGELLEEALESRFFANAWEGRAGWAGNAGSGGIELGIGYKDSFYSKEERRISHLGRRSFDNSIASQAGDLAVRYDQTLRNDAWFEARVLQGLERITTINESLQDGAQRSFGSTQLAGESILRANLRWAPFDNASNELGTELIYNYLDANQDFKVDGVEIPLPLADTRVSEMRGEIFSNLTRRYRDHFTIEMGINLEYSLIRQTGDSSANRSFFYPKPRLAVTWSRSANDQLRFRLERELGQLNFGDFAASVALSDGEVLGGNIDLRPEQRWISEIVWERRLANDGVLVLTLRRDYLVDAIDRIPLEKDLTAIGNIGSGTLHRLAADIRLPLDKIGMEGAFVRIEGRYNDTQVTDPTTGEYRRQSNVRRFEGSFRLERDEPDKPLTWGILFLPYYRHPIYHPDQFRYFSPRNILTAFVEYKVTGNVDFRIELTTWNDLEIGRDVYADRQSQELAFSERQYINPRDRLRVRLRKTF